MQQLLRTIDELVDDPCPEHSFPFGSGGLRRLRSGRYRVLYEIQIDVISIGRVARRPDKG